MFNLHLNMREIYSTCVCEAKKIKEQKTSFLSALLVIIIPKCPFCIMAYSSAITVCGGQDMYLHSNNWVSYIPIFLALMVNGILLFNYKGRKTVLAIATSLLAFAMILGAHQTIISSEYYNIGSILLLLSIWFNGSFFHFLNTIAKKVSNAKA